MNKWECLGGVNEEFHNMHRMKIPGGWLVKLSSDVISQINTEYSISERTGYEWRESITFVPDPNYEWVIDNE